MTREQSVQLHNDHELERAHVRRAARQESVVRTQERDLARRRNAVPEMFEDPTGFVEGGLI